MTEDVDRLAELIWSTLKLRITMLAVATLVFMIVWSSLQKTDANASSVSQRFCPGVAASYAGSIGANAQLSSMLQSACSGRSAERPDLDTARVFIEQIEVLGIPGLQFQLSDYERQWKTAYTLSLQFLGGSVDVHGLWVPEVVPFIGLLLLSTVIILGWRERYYKQQLAVLLRSVEPGDRSLALARSRFLAGIPYEPLHGSRASGTVARMVAAGPEPLVVSGLYGAFAVALVLLLHEFSDKLVHLTDSIFFSYPFALYSAVFITGWMLLKTRQEYCRFPESAASMPQTRPWPGRRLIGMPRFAAAAAALAVFSFSLPWLMTLEYPVHDSSLIGMIEALFHVQRTPVAKGYQFLINESPISLPPKLADQRVLISPGTFNEIRVQLWFALLFLALCGIDTANRFHPFLAGPRSVQRARRRMAGAILFLCANYWIYMCVLWYQQTIGVAWPAYVPLPKGISMINFAPDYGFCLFTACCACLIWASFQAEYQEQSEVAAPVFAVPEENEA